MIETSVKSVILIGFVVQFRPERIKDIAIRFGVSDEQQDDVLGDDDKLKATGFVSVKPLSVKPLSNARDHRFSALSSRSPLLSS